MLEYNSRVWLTSACARELCNRTVSNALQFIDWNNARNAVSLITVILFTKFILMWLNVIDHNPQSTEVSTDAQTYNASNIASAKQSDPYGNRCRVAVVYILWWARYSMVIDKSFGNIEKCCTISDPQFTSKMQSFAHCLLLSTDGVTKRIRSENKVTGWNNDYYFIRKRTVYE